MPSNVAAPSRSNGHLDDRPNDHSSDRLNNPSSTTKDALADLPLTESPIKKRISRRTWIKVVIATIIVIALLGYLAWDIVAKGPLMTLLTNRDRLVDAVNSWGAFAPLLYIMLQVLQTVVAPIPGQIVGSIGGFLFGPWGILWTSIGTLIGCWIVFKIARRFGRPLLEKLFKKSAVDKFDFIINAKSASLILFAIFLLPGFPDDIICYIAGLTNLSIKRLMAIVILGRFPVIVLTNYIGAEVGTNFVMVALVALLAVVILGIGIWQRERIMAFLKRGATPASSSEDAKSLKNSESSKDLRTSKKPKN